MNPVIPPTNIPVLQVFNNFKNISKFNSIEKTEQFEMHTLIKSGIYYPYRPNQSELQSDLLEPILRLPKFLISKN